MPADIPANESVGQNGKVWEVELRDDPSAPEIKSEIVATDLGEYASINDVNEYGVLITTRAKKNVIVVKHNGTLKRMDFKKMHPGVVLLDIGAMSFDGKIYFQKENKDRKMEILEFDPEGKIIKSYKPIRDGNRVSIDGAGGVLVDDAGMYYGSAEKIGGKNRKAEIVRSFRRVEKDNKTEEKSRRNVYGISDTGDVKERRPFLLYKSGVYEDTLTTEGDWQIITAYSKSGKIVGRIKFNPKLFPKSNPDYETSIRSIFMDRKGRIHAMVVSELFRERREGEKLGEVRYLVLEKSGKILIRSKGGPQQITADGVGYVVGPHNGNFLMRKYWIDER